MTLSTGTLNLKFMQRAVAKVPSTETTTTTTTTAKPVTTTTSASTTSPPLSLGEDTTKWILPSRSTSSRSVGAETVRFESSYLPFLRRGEGDESIVRARGGGGRMAFGGFGEVEEAEGSRGDGDAEEGAGDGEEADTRRKGKIRGQDKEGNHKRKVHVRDDEVLPDKRSHRNTSPSPPTTTTSNTFRRPAGFSPPPAPSLLHKPLSAAAKNPPHSDRKLEPGSSPPRPMSTADRIRQTISASRKPGQAADKADAGEITSMMPPVLSPTKTNMVKPDPGETKLDIDARERLLKAERKREKNARRRARKSAVQATNNG